MTLHQALQQAKITLASVTDTPSLEAELLLAYTLNQSRDFLYAWPEQSLTAEQQSQYAHYVQRRCHREPIAYLTGCKEFWSLDLKVTRETLIPRPETEGLVAAVLELTSELPPHAKVADLGTGSGAIALALAHERPDWQIYACDNNENTLCTAKHNAQRLGLNAIFFMQGEWCQALPCNDFDVIVSNPPYLAETEWEEYAHELQFEPRAALVSGRDGLQAIRDISVSTTHYLRPGGYLLLEHGFRQGPAVRDCLTMQGYKSIHSLRDLAGHERITQGRLCR